MLPLSVTVMVKSSVRTVNVLVALSASAAAGILIHPNSTEATVTTSNKEAITQNRLPSRRGRLTVLPALVRLF
jgi:hypothetical protein